MKRRIRDTHEFPYVYKLYDTGGGAFRRGAVNSDTVKNALWEMTEGYGEA